jgi:hypothetical protein
MEINLLVTKEMWNTKPDNIRVPIDFGEIVVRFPSEEAGEEPLIMVGNNAILEGLTDDFIRWLKPFDGVAVGVGGSPQFERFEIMHIDKNL